MRIALIANPGAGSGGGADEAERLLVAAGADVERLGPHVLGAGGDVPDALGRAERLAVASGDGGVGPAAALAAVAGLPLAVLPTGTANDFARSAGIPLDLEGAVRLAADAAAPLRPLDLARLDGRPFVNVATAGLSVLAARIATPHKPRLGALAYAFGAVRAAAAGRPFAVRVGADGEEVFAGRAWQVAIACGGAFGGGAATGGADPGDGRLDAVVVPAGSRIALGRHAAAMRAGRLAALPETLHVRAARIDLAGPRELNVDGELCPCGSATTATVAARAFSVVVPES